MIYNGNSGTTKYEKKKDAILVTFFSFFFFSILYSPRLHTFALRKIYYVY